MELIDKKLSEKLKMFEYIDKKYGTNEDIKTKTIPKKSSQNKSLLDQKDYYYSKQDIYNNIYSDFNTNSPYVKNLNPLSRKATLDSNKEKPQANKFKKINNNDMVLNTSRTRMKNNNTNVTKNSKKFYPPNDSGNRLYNYGYYIKNKLIKKREKEDENIKRQMTPKILNRSKEMIKDKYRDPNKFEERLYYAERNNTNDSIYNRKRTFSKDKLDYNNNTFTYHPKINKKSLLIANKLEPSIDRITRKKSNNNIIEEKTVLNYYSNLFKDNKIYNYKKKSSTITNINCGNQKSNELYIKGLQDMKKKEKTYNDNIKKKGEEYKNYSYHPLISKPCTNKKQKNKKEDIYIKNKEWKMKLENENNIKKKKYDEIENKKYTFKPEINKINIKNDIPFIMKNIQQMNEYVNKRRKVLKQKKEEENYKNKKFYLDTNNYTFKTTIPKEFDLKTEKRSISSNKKKRDINFIKKEFYKNVMKNNMHEEEQKNNFWNYNNFNKGMKIGGGYSTMTQSQQDFLDAVNDLHLTMDKLKI